MNLFGDRRTCRFFSSLLVPWGTAVSPKSVYNESNVFYRAKNYR